MPIHSLGLWPRMPALWECCRSHFPEEPLAQRGTDQPTQTCQKCFRVLSSSAEWTQRGKGREWNRWKLEISSRESEVYAREENGQEEREGEEWLHRQVDLTSSGHYWTRVWSWLCTSWHAAAAVQFHASETAFRFQVGPTLALDFCNEKSNFHRETSQCFCQSWVIDLPMKVMQDVYFP